MKKRNFYITLLTSLLLSFYASAQNYYDPGYYSQQQPAYYPSTQQGYYYPTQAYQYPVQQQQMQQVAARPQANGGNNYPAHIVKQQKKGRDFGSIYVGADYVIGYSSYTDEDFTIESALTDGKSFVSDSGSFDRNLNSISLNLGWRPHRNIGIEAFYQTSLDENKVVYTESYTQYPEFARGEYEVSYKVLGLDLLGYIPINDYIEFIASIGVGKYDAEAEVKVVAYENIAPSGELRSTSKTFEDSAVAYRLGGGFQIWLSKHLTLRAMVRWTQIGGDFMDYITEGNIGVRYHF